MTRKQVASQPYADLERNTMSDQGWTLAQVVEATGGKITANSEHIFCRRISTDSRSIEPGDLFVALCGENFDGEKFVADAVRKGAAGCVMTGDAPHGLAVPVVWVPDTLKALGDLAAYRRRRMKYLKVIGITGSSGKTTVKEMTAAILGRIESVLKTGGNFNNLIGMPLSLLPVSDKHRVAILEMGMNRPGEIARMAEIAAPDIVCINNVQNAHLQGLDNIHGVAKAKEEIFAGAGTEATLVVNIDDGIVREIAGKYRQKKITFGTSPNAQVRGSYIYHRGEKGVSFTLGIGAKKVRVKMQCVGRHNVSNALAAAALAYGAGAGLDEIASGLATFTPYDKRLQIEKVYNGVMVVNDTYNANPASMVAALETVERLSRGRRSVAVIGDMLELGEESTPAHRLIGETVAELGFDYLLTFGPLARNAVEVARKLGMGPSRAIAYDSKDKIVAMLCELIRKKQICPGDWVLVKGSRGVRMETVVSGLQEAGE